MRIRVIKEKWLEIILSLVIMSVCIVNLWRLYGPLIVPDETGYWATGYFFSGYNWSGVMGTSSYYGWGYGVVLAIICSIVPNPIWAFRLAIIFNAILLVGCFLFAIKVSLYIFPQIPRAYRSCMCFAVTVYSGYIYYSQTSYCEVLILFLYWLSVYLLIKLIEKNSYKYVILLALNISYLGAVHLRTVVLLFAIFLCLFVLVYKKKISYKHLVVFTFLCIILYFGVWEVKNYLAGTLYKTSTLMATNDVTGQISKLSLLCSWEGIKQFVGSIIGKVFYTGTATFLLLYLSILLGIKKIIKVYIRKEEDFSTYELIFVLFIFCGFIGEILLSSYSLITYGRIDHILYGRYTEFILGVIMLYALGKIYTKFDKQILILSVITHVSVCAVAFRFIVNKDYLGRASSYAIPGISGIYVPIELDEKMQLTLYVGGVALVVFLIIFLIYHIKNKWIVLIGLSTIWISIAYICANRSLYSEQQYQERAYSEFAEEIEDIVKNEDVYYIINDTEYVSWLKFKLKFFLPETEMIACESYEYNRVKSGEYLILYNNDYYYDEIMETLGEKVYDSEFFALYRKE